MLCCESSSNADNLCQMIRENALLQEAVSFSRSEGENDSGLQRGIQHGAFLVKRLSTAIMSCSKSTGLVRCSWKPALLLSAKSDSMP